jgi:hypothetical protein
MTKSLASHREFARSYRVARWLPNGQWLGRPFELAGLGTDAEVLRDRDEHRRQDPRTGFRGR